MKPKNSSERSSAFYKFLILFLVTTSTVVGAVYFNFKVPKQENSLLREQAQVFDDDLKFQKGFYKEMQSLLVMIDSLEKPGTIVDFEASQISSRLAALSSTIPGKDSTNLSDMNQEIIKLLLELKNDKVKLYQLRNAQGEIENLRKSLQNCEDALSAAQTRIAILQN